MNTYGKMIGIMIDENDVSLVKKFAKKLPEYHVGKILADTYVMEYEAKKAAMESRHQDEDDIAFGGVRVKVYCPVEAANYFNTAEVREYFESAKCDFAEQIAQASLKSSYRFSA